MRSTRHHKRTQRPKLSIRDALQMMRLLSESTLSEEEICEALDIHRSTMFRMLADMRKELGVDIQHDESLGGYRVADWGVIDRRRI